MRTSEAEGSSGGGAAADDGGGAAAARALASVPAGAKAIFGVAFCSLKREALAERIARGTVPRGAGPRVVVTANLDHVVQLRGNAELRAAYARAWAATIDGAPVLLYARLRGAAVPGRVVGSDLLVDVVGRLAPGQHRCFFVAASEATAAGLRAVMQGHGFAAEAVATEVPPHGFEHDAGYGARLVARIQEHGTTHLLMGVGAPKSEIWTDRARGALGDCYVLNVGSGLDFLAGTRPRAPRVLRRAGMEWLWRFAHEPRRLFRRYFVNSWRFIGAVREDLGRDGPPP